VILHTIHQDFNRENKMRKILALFLTGIFLLSGCETMPKDALTLSPEALAQRQIQTKKYETTDEVKILSACAGLLQDMGFNLDESESKLGLISASKKRSAVDGGQIALSLLMAVLTGVASPTDKEQTMRVSVVTRPVGENPEYIAVRVTFQRIVVNDQNQVSKSESLTDPSIYQEFFDKLSKSIFLEAQEL
jgi:hypothetical protein